MSEIPSWANWVARDEDGFLWFYSEKPMKEKEKWISIKNVGNCARVINAEPYFKFVKWEDEKPVAIVRHKDETKEPIEPVSLHESGVWHVGTEKTDSIEPTHYKQNNKDLIDSWKERMSEDQFRESMKTHIDKYVWRYNKKNGVEDLDKATEFIRRLKEWELER